MANPTRTSKRYESTVASRQIRSLKQALREQTPFGPLNATSQPSRSCQKSQAGTFGRVLGARSGARYELAVETRIAEGGGEDARGYRR